MKDRRLFLLDGTALAYRSHFALARSQRLTSRSGAPTGATHGFLLTLRRLLEKEDPPYLAVALDPPGPTFRHARYPEYKATRQRAPEDLLVQLPTIRSILEAYRIAVVEKPGFEADDVIGTIARRAEKEGYEVYLVTKDKDFAQLVTERVRFYDLFRPGEPPEILGPKEIEAQFGVPPQKIVDLLALVGDTSDNVPGVGGVGEKTAGELLRTFGSFEEIFARRGEISRAKVREALARDEAQARLARELVTIDTAVPLDLPLEGLARRPPDEERLRALFVELDLRSLLTDVASDADGDEHRWIVVDSPASFEEMLARCRETKLLAVDTETTSTDPMRADLVGVSLSPAPREAWYVPLRPTCPLPGGREEVLERLRALLGDGKLPKSGQNLKYDLVVLARQGVEVAAVAFDTLLADYCVDPTSRERNLDVLALRHLHYRKIPTGSLIGKGKAPTMDLAPVEEVARYACEDADVVQRLVPLLERELARTGAERLFREIEMPLVPVLAAMERRGIRVDVDRLRRLSGELGGRIERLADEVQALAGEAFNVASNPQLGAVLFEKMRIQERSGGKRPRRTKTGWAVDAETLEAYEGEPIVAKVLEFRSLSKLKSTYLDALPGLVHPETGRIHTSFNQTVAATGRLSSSDPNLQNIPIRTELGREIRRAFVPGAKGWKLLSADYSQIELRLVAHLAGEERLLEAFETGADIHHETAAAIFHGGDARAVRPEERTRAKAINFGILYGMGPARLARETQMAFEEAQAFIRVYFETFPKVRAFLDATLANAKKKGYVETLFGRRRPIPEIASEDPRVQALAQNVAVNTPVQGSAADLIKKAMIGVERRMREGRFGGGMLLQVHDELVLEAPEREIEGVADLVREEMEGAAALSVKLRVDVGWGDDWLVAHEPRAAVS